MKGRFSATAGALAGLFSVAFFAGVVGWYLSQARPGKANAASDPDHAASVASGQKDDPNGAPAVSSADPPSTTSTVTTVGGITVVDVALGITSLSSELRHQHAEAVAHGERLLLLTIESGRGCLPCQGIAAALSDPRMQTALDKIRLVRVDHEPFEEDLTELEIPTRPIPGFFLLDSNLRITDGINGGEWDDDIADNIAPVLDKFVRGHYAKRRSPWKKLPRPGGTVL